MTEWTKQYTTRGPTPAEEQGMFKNLGIEGRNWTLDPIYRGWLEYLGIVRGAVPVADTQPIGFGYVFTIDSLAAASYYKTMMPDEWEKFRVLHRIGAV